MVITGAEMLDEGERTDLLPIEQREPLLQTKLFVPLVRPNRVARPRLFNQMQSGLDKALILISAPAGYGKTTLVSSWLRETEFPSTWLSLDEDDNDPIHFLQYFITALQKIVPTIQLDLLGLLQDSQPASFKFLLNIIINEIAGRASPFVLILDDFHVIYALPVLEMITHLLERLPPQMRVVILTRTDPLLPLARLRARNQLIEIRVAQLRFTLPEITIFLEEVMGLKLSTNDLIALEARTEGWIAGLQLASIALQATASKAHISSQISDDVHGFVAAFSGSHHYIMDYLLEEVLKLQTETVRSFLLQSSILERMCGALCEEVIEAERGYIDGQAMLETLEEMNLFIIPLDGERRWYRYHHLFADVLNRRVEQESPLILDELHRRASRWYEQNGFISQAIQHARTAGDLERAAQLVDQNGCTLLMRGETTNLLQWIEAIDPYSQAMPWIAIQKGWALCLTGQLEDVEAPLQMAEQLIAALEPSDETRTMSGAVTAARACRANAQGEPRRAIAYARQALDNLPPSDDFSCGLRSVSTSILGDASWLEGNLAEAQRAYVEAARIGRTTDNVHMVIIANFNLAEVLVEQGQLQQAERTYSEALQMAISPDGQLSPLAEKVYTGLGKIAYEWNRLDEAARYIQLCIELSQQWGNFETEATGVVLSARLEHVRGNSEKARKGLRSVEQLISDHLFTPWLSISLTADLARLWIAEGNLEKAAYLVQQSAFTSAGIPEAGEISHIQEPLLLARLRLHLARGDYEAALALSDRMLQSLDGSIGAGRVIETLVLRALAWQGKKDIDRALAALEKALSLAQPGGYVRIFLDEGEPMAKLLFQAKAHRIGQGYALELLSALGGTTGTELPLTQLLIEPLTARELEVLKLIEAGCSNQDIADDLVISMPTVKRHISNIYAKLGVESRTQAVSLGKELKLFE